MDLVLAETGCHYVSVGSFVELAVVDDRMSRSGVPETVSVRAQVAKPACTWSWCVSSLNHWGADPRR
jgi:hypothetical protein